MSSHPELPEPVITSASGRSLEKHNGLEAMLFWLESGLHAYWWEKFQLLTLDMHSCAFLDPVIVGNVISSFFEIVEVKYLDLRPDSEKTDSPKIELRRDLDMGRSVFAKEKISEGEFIAGFYGEVYVESDAMAVPAVAVDHAAQFAEKKWRDGLIDGAARYLNHSCSPNCGVKGLHDLVAMREIMPGEELCWDYAMTEDSNWEVPGNQCFCGTARCRGNIFRYGQLSDQEKREYQDYTSLWLLKKYRLAPRPY